MVFKREDALKAVVDGLAWLAKSCELRGVLHLLDNHVLSHHFFCRLLNVLYGLKLEVMDRIQSNYTAIDLGDTENRTAFQVTAEKSGAKVQDTLNKFVGHGLHTQFDSLKVLVIGKQQERYTALTIPKEITFNPAKDILDLTTLSKDIERLSTPLLESLACVFDEELKTFRQMPSRFCRIELHHGPDELIYTHENINIDHCELHGRPVMPPWLLTTPKRMSSDWLVARLPRNGTVTK